LYLAGNQNTPIQMKKHLHSAKRFFFLLFIFFQSFAYSQNSIPLLFKSGNIEKNINREESKQFFDLAKQNKNGDHFLIIQFNEIPTNEVKSQLADNGITLLNYMPKNAYYALIQSSASFNILASANMKAVYPILPTYKLSKDLAMQKYNDYALVNKNAIALNAVFYKTISNELVYEMLDNFGAKNITVNNSQVATFNVNIAVLDELYNLYPFYYFEQIDPPSLPENLVGVTNHRSNNLATSYTNGLHLDGSGVTVMLQDNSKLDEHIDYTGRFVNMNASNSGDHGEHCGGIIAGAGNIDPTTRGMAYGAEVLVYSPSDANYNLVPNLVQNSNLTITSKSYGGGLNAGYNTIARTLDQQIRNYPELIHVFSAGNSNGSGFTSAGSQWFNITGGHKSAKNVLAVGNLTFTDVIANSSSRGPSEDGRIKPDICAVGTNVYSTVDPNSYDTKTGTSMACPGVAGTLAQLYQGYKELNNGNNPNSALIKGAILNTADDLGNEGPDFIYGWGRINARRAYNLISNGNYFTDEISQGDNLNHTISVPAGIAQVRVMVYWSDYEASTSASQVLVNDINMTLMDPTGSTNLPWVLDNSTNATALNSPAITAVDDVNNMEQITIDNPSPGAYTVNLEGFSIPSGPQKYFVVYELATDDVVLTYPIGGEGFDPTENEIIRWDALNDNGAFTLEYSIDNGLSWTTLSSNISADRRYYSWNVPNIVSGEALVRVSRGSSSSQSHEPFSIIGVPSGLQVLSVCPDSVELSWNAVANATGYEVSMLGNFYMDSVATTTTTSVKVAHSSANDFWWSVKALGANNCEGRRAIAQFQSAGTTNCVLAFDVAVNDPQSINGRNILSCMAGDTLDIGINLVNAGTNSISNIPVYYKLNNNTVISETYNGTLQPSDVVYFSFTNQTAVPFGTNTLDIWADYGSDQNSDNDTINSTFNYLNASPITLPFFEDFESFNLCNTTSNCEAEICQLTNNFVNSSNGVVDDIDWRTNANTTPSSGTGPSTDFNPGNSNGKYLYLEPSATPICADKSAHLITPCIDLADGGILTFAYHMLGTDMGELHVDILVNGVWINDIMPVINGNQGGDWLQASVNLNAYAGSIINIRFRGITGDNYRSDIAIDDIGITSSLGLTDTHVGSLKLYPNPSNGQFFYELSNASLAQIEIIDASGKLMRSMAVSNQKGVIDMTSAAKGIYFVKVIANERITVQKIMLK
jgi:subtilisin family serine protease